jgi:hypothetical protein
MMMMKKTRISLEMGEMRMMRIIERLITHPDIIN